MSARSHFETLEFDLPGKLLQELVDLFEAMPRATLSPDVVTNTIREEQGVYQLFKGDELVYIGKTDSRAGLQHRLLRHAHKIQMRRNLSIEDVSFKAIRLYVFTAVDLESLLIAHYKVGDKVPAWQHSGFGSNDPGRERDTTKVKATNFDGMYPIDLDLKVYIESNPIGFTVADLLQQLKDKLSFIIRFARSGGSKPHADLLSTEVEIESASRSIREFLQISAKALGDSWQITELPGYVIVYKEKAPKKYPAGKIIR